jgi:hypothetical protein
LPSYTSTAPHASVYAAADHTVPSLPRHAVPSALPPTAPRRLTRACTRPPTTQCPPSLDSFPRHCSAQYPRSHAIQCPSSHAPFSALPPTPRSVPTDRVALFALCGAGTCPWTAQRLQHILVALRARYRYDGSHRLLHVQVSGQHRAYPRDRHLDRPHAHPLGASASRRPCRSS